MLRVFLNLDYTTQLSKSLCFSYYMTLCVVLGIMMSWFAHYMTNQQKGITHYKIFHQKEYLTSLSSLQTEFCHMRTDTVQVVFALICCGEGKKRG